MQYPFSCTKCGIIERYIFLAAEYDQHVHSEEDGEGMDGLHRTELCPKCGTKTMYRHISADTMPGVMGGTRGYKSMERFWSENPGLARQKEEEILKKRDERFRKQVLDRIDKQKPSNRKSNRHKGYGKGNGEERLRLDD